MLFRSFEVKCLSLSENGKALVDFMKKYVLDLIVTENIRLHDQYVLLKLTHDDQLPPMLPGQFAELRVDNSPATFLRRPI